MFKINDYVVYKSTGVYKIVDFKKQMDINNEETEYYVMQPAFGNNLTIMAPVNNYVTMRHILTKDDVLSLISSMPEQETIWVKDQKQRSESFKEALKTGESEEWAKLIKTIYLKKQEKASSGGKLMKTDEDIMRSAEKNLYEEFAVALGISPDEVVSYIHEHIPQE